MIILRIMFIVIILIASYFIGKKLFQDNYYNDEDVNFLNIIGYTVGGLAALAFATLLITGLYGLSTLII